MKNYFFSSKIKAEYEEELKYLLYFNPQQNKVVSGIEASIEKYGIPRIIKTDIFLNIAVGNLKDVQSIFAFDTARKGLPLIGIMIYYRESENILTLLHIAVKEEYSLNSSSCKYSLTIEMIEELKNIARKLKKINTIIIYYKKDKKGEIKIKQS